MTHDAMSDLWLATLSSSAATLIVLALRKILRRRFGARAAYVIWTLVPFAALAALLPAPVIAPAEALIAAPMQVLSLTPLHDTTTAAPFDALPWLAASWWFGALA